LHGDDVTQITPTLKILRGVAAQLVGLGEQVDKNLGRFFLEVPRDHEAIAAIIPFPAKDGNAAGRIGSSVSVLFEKNFGNALPGVFHQLVAGHDETFGRQTIHFLHFGSG